MTDAALGKGAGLEMVFQDVLRNKEDLLQEYIAIKGDTVTNKDDNHPE